MAPPSKSQIKVATDALRTEAGTWDQQSSALDKIVSQADGLRLERIEAGIFQVIFDAYASVVDQVTARSREGRQRMTDVANTLHKVADTYEEEDVANLHLVKNLY
ncbi:MAG TPA: hypothetical protein VGO16_16215 [Pseudonocardiaceae bacterium]|jgi:uncharacterized protein YukE|nr:hypothetical protein [Pseudonocardiaceae bacterium]